MLRVDGVSMQTKLGLALAFQLLTGPVAAHLLAGTARRAGIPALLVIDETAPPDGGPGGSGAGADGPSGRPAPGPGGGALRP